MEGPVGPAMEPPAVPSAGVDGSSKRDGEGGDKDETQDLLFMTSSFPAGSMAAKPAMVPTSAERPAHLLDSNSRRWTADPCRALLPVCALALCQYERAVDLRHRMPRVPEQERRIVPP